jgi:hypothetical protein
MFLYACIVLLPRLDYFKTLKMEAASSSETFTSTAINSATFH